MFPRRDGTDAAAGVAADSIALIEAFRDGCTASGHKEASRTGVVRHLDPSIRFTNSTISALKPYLDSPVAGRVFLIQPAIRLRNLTHWQQHGRMSGFGCYFTALGTLSPPGLLTDVHEESVRLLIDGMGVPPARVLLRCSSADDDLHRAAAGCGLPTEVDGCPPDRYRHVFGIDGVTGRNTNIAIITDHGPVDVANVICIERRGEAIAVESAYGVNMVLAQRDQLAHPVLASAGAAALAHGVTSLIGLDAIGSAVGLLAEGLRPVARGRGGKLRAFLRLLAAADALSASALREAVGAVARADRSVRDHVSPAAPGLFEESSPQEVVESAMRGIAAVTATE